MTLSDCKVDGEVKFCCVMQVNYKLYKLSRMNIPLTRGHCCRVVNCESPAKSQDKGLTGVSACSCLMISCRWVM